MKKATNSKNRVKFSKLFPIMQEHFGQSMNLARIKLMALLLEALFKAQTVSLERLANAMPTAVDKESNMRRLQRFLACYVLDLDLIARMIFSLLPVSSGLVLTMDRTNWKYGQTDINILMPVCCPSAATATPPSASRLSSASSGSSARTA